ncbi:hypothetical protein CBL_09121 [Carabus blaptoides fortunei]
MRIPGAWRLYALIKWCFFISLAIVTTILITNSGRNEPKIIFEEMALTMHSPLTFPKENWRNFSKQQRMKSKDDLPQENTPRPTNQRWIFLTDETPIFTFLKPRVNITEFDGKFNWSMTYRIESDVPVPYGRTVPKMPKAQENIKQNEVKENIFQKRSDVLIFMENVEHCNVQDTFQKTVTE